MLFDSNQSADFEVILQKNNIKVQRVKNIPEGSPENVSFLTVQTLSDNLSWIWSDQRLSIYVFLLASRRPSSQCHVFINGLSSGSPLSFNSVQVEVLSEWHRYGSRGYDTCVHYCILILRFQDFLCVCVCVCVCPDYMTLVALLHPWLRMLLMDQCSTEPPSCPFTPATGHPSGACICASLHDSRAGGDDGPPAVCLAAWQMVGWHMIKVLWEWLLGGESSVLKVEGKQLAQYSWLRSTWECGGSWEKNAGHMLAVSSQSSRHCAKLYLHFSYYNWNFSWGRTTTKLFCKCALWLLYSKVYQPFNILIVTFLF